jgi:putative two-component system response regulator
LKDKLKKIVVMDHDTTFLNFASSALGSKHDVVAVPSNEKLFQAIQKTMPDVILLDAEMSEADGYLTLRKLKNAKDTFHIPVIFSTGKIDPESEIKGLGMGAADYITKPCSQQLFLKRVELHLLFEAQKKELIKNNISLEGMVNKKTRTVFDLQNAILKTVAELVECRDNVTGGHIERTQNYLKLFVSILLGYDEYAGHLLSWNLDLLIMSSQLHDVGKISIRDSILMKTSGLTKEEFEEIKKHTIYGTHIIEKIEESTSENEFLQYAKILAGSHHEKWDGTGYPYGLEGEDIPLQGRLMAFVDVYDALTTYRHYKNAYTHEESIELIRQGKGTHFDPRLSEIFLAHEKEFKNVVIRDYAGDIYRSKLVGVPWNSVSKAVANIVDVRRGAESGHTEKMQRHLRILANALLRHERYKEEVSAWDIDIFLVSAQLHDVGKLAVADELLNKAGKLTEEEFESIKTHTDFGVKVVRQISEGVDDGSLLRHAEALTGSHHEKWDGTGYPQGLKGGDIPLQGRLMAIVDVYNALTSNRPDRERKTHEEAVEIIKSCSGTHFDPELIDVFLAHEKKFLLI